jgi:hypothetical protein
MYVQPVLLCVIVVASQISLSFGGDNINKLPTVLLLEYNYDIYFVNITIM